MRLRLGFLLFILFLLGAFLALADNITVSKTQLTASPYVGDAIEFRLNVTNYNDSNISGFVLFDFFDTAYLSFNSSDTALDFDNAANGEIGWNVSNLSNASSFTVQVNFTAGSAGTTDNNLSVDRDNISFANTSLAVNINALPVLSVGPLLKALDGTTYEPDDIIFYDFNVTNNGTVNITEHNVTVTYNSTCLNYTNATVVPDSVDYGAGRVLWINSTTLATGTTQNILANLTALQECTSTPVTLEVNATNGSLNDLQTQQENLDIQIALDFTVFKSSTQGGGPFSLGETITFFVNISNIGQSNITEINVTDTFNASCLSYENASLQPNTTASGEVNWTDLAGTPIDNGEQIAIEINFTAIAECGWTNNTANVTATDGSTTMDSGSSENVDLSDTGGGDDWDEGLDQWQSTIPEAYLHQGVERTINFSLRRMAGDSSCLANLTILLPENVTFMGENSTTAPTGNYTFYTTGNELVWDATGSFFFCGQSPTDFLVNLTSNRTLGSFPVQIDAWLNATESSTMNLSIFTTEPFSYSGTIYDMDQQVLGGAVASITASSFSQDGDISVGTFTATTNAGGFFNITGVPGLNMTMGPDMIFYQLSATLYNDSDNNIAMYVGPSLPSLPEMELRSEFGLADPDIYLKPAFTFHVFVEGYDYQSGPINNGSGCPEACEFNWANITYGYGLKDKNMGFPVTEEFSTRTTETYFAAPRGRNYSLMLYPDASFPINIDLLDLDDSCSAGGGTNISQTGVKGNCTIMNGTYYVDLAVSSNMSLVPLTGYINETNVDDFFIATYLFEAGNMIFSQGVLPFNLRNMQTWPANASLDDVYNFTSGHYTVTLPATEASSSMLLMAYVKKGSTYYRDIINVTSSGQSLSTSSYNFSLTDLITGVPYNITTQNVSQDWNNTMVINTTAIQFYLVNESGDIQTNEQPFVDFTLESNNIEFKQMVDSTTSGGFKLPIVDGEGIEKMIIFSQNFAPISQPVSASVLSSGGTVGSVTCVPGQCNVTLKEFKPFDPENPNETIDVLMDMYISNSTCDVPNPPAGCSLTADENATKFSPLKAILKGDISLRIKSGNISVHYVRTDLLASGPPDAAFSQNQSGDDFNAAWKFGSSGPDIYSEVLLRFPYAASLENSTINVTIPVLYDVDFNVVWNSSAGDNTSNLTDGEYADYLDTDYEAYLNGTGVVCNTTDENLTSSLCYKDGGSGVLWIKIPHFSGVGPLISGSASSGGEANFTVTKAAFSSQYAQGDLVLYEINITNNDNQNITLVTMNDTYNSSHLVYNTSDVTATSNGTGFVYWANVTEGSAIAPGSTFSLYLNLSAIGQGENVSNSVLVNATVANGSTGLASTGVNITLIGPDTTDPMTNLWNPTGYYNASSAGVTFNVSVTDDRNLTNTTLYGNFSGTWGANETNNSGINNTFYLFSLNLSDGLYVWNALSCDATGNCAFNSTNYTFRVDTTAPTIHSVSTDDEDNVSSNSQYILVTVNASDAGTGVTSVAAGGTALTNSGATIWSGNITVSGTGNVTINVTDLLGNSATDTNLYITVDDTLPVVTLLTPANGNTSDTGDVFVNWTVNDTQFRNVSYSVDGNRYTGVSANETTVYNLSSGFHTLAVRAYDKADNAGYGYANFTVDTGTNASKTMDNLQTNNTWANGFNLTDAGNASDYSAEENLSLSGTYLNLSFQVNQSGNASDTVVVLANVSGLNITWGSNFSVSNLSDNANTNITGLGATPIQTLSVTLMEDFIQDESAYWGYAQFNVTNTSWDDVYYCDGNGTNCAAVSPCADNNFTSTAQLDCWTLQNSSGTEWLTVYVGHFSAVVIALDNLVGTVSITSPENASTQLATGSDLDLNFTVTESVAGNYTFDNDYPQDLGTAATSFSFRINGTLNRSQLGTGIVANGNHNITLNLRDDKNNTDQVVHEFIVNDTSAPTISSIAITGTSTTNDEGTMTITANLDEYGYCWVSTNSSINASENISVFTAMTGGLSTSPTYTVDYTESGSKGPYYISCRDVHVNNMTFANTTGSISVTLDNESDDDSGSLGGSTPYWTATFVPSTADLVDGYVKTLSETERIKFGVDIGLYYLYPDEILDKTVQFNITSSPVQQSTMVIGQEKKFDVNSNGYYDIKLRLNAIPDEANLTLWTIYEPASDEPEPIVTDKRIIKIPPGKGLRGNEKLLAAIQKHLVKGNMNENAIAHMLALAEAIADDVEIERDFEQSQGRTKIRTLIRYGGKDNIENLFIYEEVPKEFAASAEDITVTAPGATVAVVEEDPAFMILFSSVPAGGSVAITYEADGDPETAVLDEFTTELYPENLLEAPQTIEAQDEGGDGLFPTNIDEETVSETDPGKIWGIILWVLAVGIGLIIFLNKNHFIGKGGKKPGKQHKSHHEHHEAKHQHPYHQPPTHHDHEERPSSSYHRQNH